MMWVVLKSLRLHQKKEFIQRQQGAIEKVTFEQSIHLQRICRKYTQVHIQDSNRSAVKKSVLTPKDLTFGTRLVFYRVRLQHLGLNGYSDKLTDTQVSKGLLKALTMGGWLHNECSNCPLLQTFFATFSSKTTFRGFGSLPNGLKMEAKFDI